MTTSLLQKLQKNTEVPVRKCKYATILDSLDVNTRDFILERTALPQRHPHRLSYAMLTKVLRSENHEIGRSSIGEHYNTVCCCTSVKEFVK